jgi:hypothetical protein
VIHADRAAERRRDLSALSVYASPLMCMHACEGWVVRKGLSLRSPRAPAPSGSHSVRVVHISESNLSDAREARGMAA